MNSYEEIKQELMKHMVKIEMEGEDMCKVEVGKLP